MKSRSCIIAAFSFCFTSLKQIKRQVTLLALIEGTHLLHLVT